jgi:hypothetical protein
MPEPEYGERYCAFIDILGFSVLIENLDVGSTPLNALRDLLSKVHNPPATQGASSPRADSGPRAFQMPWRCRRRLSLQV